jgi:hypothetical protein
MTPPRSHALDLLAEPLAVCRLAADAPMPAWAHTGPLASVTRTAAELSIVCAAAAVPADVAVVAAPWRALRVAGPLDLSEVGVMASLAGALAAAGVSVFTVATYDTDYLLVRETALDAAVAALRGAGHVVRGA